MRGCDVRSDELNCFAGVIDARCSHSHIVVADRKPRELPHFAWVNAVLGNLKTTIKGEHKSIKFSTYARKDLGAYCYCFNRRFDLQHMVGELSGHRATARPLREQAIRHGTEFHHRSSRTKARCVDFVGS